MIACVVFGNGDVLNKSDMILIFTSTLKIFSCLETMGSCCSSHSNRDNASLLLPANNVKALIRDYLESINTQQIRRDQVVDSNFPIPSKSCFEIEDLSLEMDIPFNQLTTKALNFFDNELKKLNIPQNECTIIQKSVCHCFAFY